MLNGDCFAYSALTLALFTVGEYISEKALGECDVEFPYQVPENSYFVMGDKRETSVDSRSSVIGCVSEDQIIGKIFCKFWPLSEFDFID